MQQNQLRKIAIVTTIGLLLTVTFATLVSSALAPVSTNKSVPSRGSLTVINLAVYSDSACTSNLTFLDFGSINSGDSSNITCWVKNIGNSNETLSLTTDSWSPESVTQWLTLSWNQTDTVLDKNEVVAATLSMQVSPSVDPSLSDFTLNVVIAGTAI